MTELVILTPYADSEENHCAYQALLATCFCGNRAQRHAFRITGAIAWVVKPAVDEILGNRRYGLIKFLAIGIILLFVVKGLISFGQTYLMKSAGMKLVRDMRNRLYRHILDLPISYFAKESSGVTVARVMFDVDSLSSLISNVIRNFVVEIPTMLVLIGVALYRKWDLTLITLVLLPFIALSTRKFGKRIKHKRKQAQRKLSHITQRIGETIVGIRIIKVFNRASSMGASLKQRASGSTGKGSGWCEQRSSPI